MNLGDRHRRSVVILWTWTLLLSGFVLYPTMSGRNPAYLPFGIIALVYRLFTVLHPSVRARRRESEHPGPGLDGAPAAVAGHVARDDLREGETLTEGLPPAGSTH